MEPRENFIVRGKKSVMVPVSRRAPVVMMAPPPATESPAGRNKAAYGRIMNELSNTKSRIFKVCYTVDIS